MLRKCCSTSTTAHIRCFSPSFLLLPSTNKHRCRYSYIHTNTSSSSRRFETNATPSSITFLTDVEGDGHYFDRFIRHSKILGFRSFHPTFGRHCHINSKKRLRNYEQQYHDQDYFPYDKEVVFLDDHENGNSNYNNSMLVYGGDIWDKGGADLYVIRQLLSLHRRYPNRVHFIMGNRDINKLRIIDELGSSCTTAVTADHHHPRLLSMHKGVYWLRGTGLRGDPEKYSEATTMTTTTAAAAATETAAERLKWMLRSTMGSPDAFELRRQELQRERLAMMIGQPAFPSSTQECSSGHNIPISEEECKLQTSSSVISDDDVLTSYIQSCGPNSVMSEYLSNAKLMIRFGSVLFLHGAFPSITANSFPRPWIDTRSDDKENGCAGGHQTFTEWLNDLNEFASDQITLWKKFGKTRQLYDEEGFWSTKGGYSNSTTSGKLFGNLLQYGMNMLPDGSKNPSVVYSSWMKDGMPREDLISSNEKSIETLFEKEGVQLILSGHQPVGDMPWPIQLSNNRWILPCDTSFSGDVRWTTTDHCHSSAERVSLGRGSRPNGRGEIAVSETLITFCQNTGKLKSIKINGYLSDGSHYETNNLLDVSDDNNKHVGRPFRSIGYDGKESKSFWVKAKIGREYLLSAGKGFHVWNATILQMQTHL